MDKRRGFTPLEITISNKEREKFPTGFTLIELLVVIAIIAILMAILMPALEAARLRAQDMMCTAHLRAVGLGVLLYLDDFEGAMAWVGDDRTDRKCNGFRWFYPGTKNLMLNTETEAYWGVNYINYAKSRKVFGCPAFKDVAAELIYPQMEAYLVNEAGYGLNAFSTNKNISEVRIPAKFVYCMDHVEPRVDDLERDMLFNTGPGTMNLTHYRSGNRNQQYRFIFRHAVKFDDDFKTGGKANILWLDGHVSWLWETTGDDVPEWWFTGQ